MIAGVADTHTALWYLFNDGCLSVAAGDFIDKAAAAGSQIVVSSISLAEIVARGEAIFQQKPGHDTSCARTRPALRRL